MLDAAAAGRVHAEVAPTARASGGEADLEAAWPALAPVFAASPYLADLARRDPPRLLRTLSDAPQARLAAILAQTQSLALDADVETAGGELRRLKAGLHLLTALADLGGAWTLEAATDALSRFADGAIQAALAAVARGEQAAGRLLATGATGEPTRGPVPGLFCLALGKLGGCELNYSSDIDICLFYAPDTLPVAPGADSDVVAVRIARGLAGLLQARTADGYVFRVDLRLRPEPAATPPAMPVEAALSYYQTAGQNWERAALIKARPCAGDQAQARAFLRELDPFVWRRSLDFDALADIHAIKRQIHVHKVDERLSAPGHNLKLGAGGIREIEFFVQVQQLIVGGRDPSLRSPRTQAALFALAAAGRITPQAARDLDAAYCDLRAWEHRTQMIADAQTHVLPQADAQRRPIAALAGFGSLAEFDHAVSTRLAQVNARYGELFAGEEPLSSSFGSLVFTGVEDDPETLATLARMGFQHPASVSTQIRAWHYGRIAATRTARGRELFTRLAPRLLEACHAAGAPDAAFVRFADFFARLSLGVQVQSMLLAQPRLLELIVEVMAFAPQLAATLARHPGTLDSLIDPAFFQPIAAGSAQALLSRVLDEAAMGVQTSGFEAAMNATRRFHREQTFRIGVQLISGLADAEAAGGAFTALADACMQGLAPRALAETVRTGGAFPGEVAIVALGKAGSGEMTARSDLDLMTLYAARSGATSAIRGWDAETFYARFTQRLITALSSPTNEGGLYEVDLQLRPSGRAGPVAVSLDAFHLYYAGEAATWEAMAMTRARVVWASSAAFAGACEAAVGDALRRPRDGVRTAQDAREMRALMRRERPAAGPWDLKLADGGLVDIEFAVQSLQLIHAAAGGPLHANTGQAICALRAANLASPERLATLAEAWRLQQDVWQVLKLALQDGVDPSSEPESFQAILARAAGERDFAALARRLSGRAAAAHAAFLAVTAPDVTVGSTDI